MPPTLPIGFGTTPRPSNPQPKGDPIQRMVHALETIAERVAAQPVWKKVPITLASGAVQFADSTFDQDVYNTITGTVSAGELWVYFGNAGQNPAGCPDLRFTAGDTKQFAIPPNTYTLTFLAHGADTSACVFMGNV